MIDRLTIRMYDMGFGDCFLVGFWSGGMARYILFDCGSLNRPKAEVAKAAKDVVATCTSAAGTPRLELVVCTHRHKDHVCGFDDPVWAGVEVGEVWMPWTENPDDPVATSLRNRQSAFALALCKAIQNGQVDPEAMPLAKPGATSAKAARLALALNALTNEHAMSTLHGGFLGKPPRQFLPVEGVTAEVRTIATLPDVRFHILGPSRDPKIIKTMDPPSGQAYLTAAGDVATAGAQEGACDANWCIDETEFRRQRREKPKDETSPINTTFTEDDRKDIEELADEPEGDFAAAIDNAVNNTSLMMMIEVGNQFLLFPGDAQWGTWNVVLQESKLRRLLKRTTVLKISHHGSHNGTPKELIEDVIGAGVTAFVSTAPVKQWPNVPRPPLIAALGEKTTLARSDDDKTIESKAGFFVQDKLYIEWTAAVGAG